ncbi:hypothetical protein D1007_20434 [Hordeum vulgare]|nr:hypothetical protein D1007_20434 [Hordeum vulgare]
MADARQARAERRATHVAQTAPVGPTGTCRPPSPMVNTATGPDAEEQQGSSQPATEQPDGRTATPSLVRAFGSASRTRPKMSHGRRALAMAAELLRYRPTLDRHNDWLQRIEELVAAVGADTLMPFRLENAAATYRRLQQAMLMPCLLGHGEQEEELLGPSEGLKPREMVDP